MPIKLKKTVIFRIDFKPHVKNIHNKKVIYMPKYDIITKKIKSIINI